MADLQAGVPLQEAAQGDGKPTFAEEIPRQRLRLRL